MLKFIKKIGLKSVDSFTSVAILNGLSSLTKIFTSFLTTKLVASTVGPSGVALLGQLSNFLSFIFAFSTGGINGGVVKYIAEAKDNKNLLKFYIGTSFYLSVVFSSLIALFILLFRSYLSYEILYSSKYSIVFLVIGLTLTFYAINSILLSIINGLKYFKKYTSINILTSLFTLIISLILVITLKLKGALIALILSQTIVILITIRFIRNEFWFNSKILLKYFKWKVVSKFLKYSLMAITTALFVPATQFLIRSYVIKYFSIEEAGIWEGMNKVSNMYLVVVTTTLSIYFLPKFSETKADDKLRSEVFKAFTYVIPALISGCFLIFLLRDLIIELVFTPTFSPMADLFKFQLMGDVVKMMTWILGTVMVSRAMYKHYIAFEIITNSLLYYMSIKFSEALGLSGLCLGYFSTFTIVLILMLLMFRKLLFRFN